MAIDGQGASGVMSVDQGVKVTFQRSWGSSSRTGRTRCPGPEGFVRDSALVRSRLAYPYRFLYSSRMAKTVPFTEARAKLSELLDEIDERHEHVVITRSGRPVAVLVPADEQEILEETLEILQDESLLGALRESEEDVKAGRLKTLDEVRRDLGLA